MRCSSLCLRRLKECRQNDIYCPNKTSEGRCPGKGMINTNIRGSLFWEGVINNCRKKYVTFSLLYLSRKHLVDCREHCGSSFHAACVKEIWFATLILKFFRELATLYINKEDFPYNCNPLQVRGWWFGAGILYFLPLAEFFSLSHLIQTPADSAAAQCQLVSVFRGASSQPSTVTIEKGQDPSY